MTDLDTYFYLSQRVWIQDDAPLKLCVKSRQTGFSYSNCFRLVLLVSAEGARLDAYISSRDQFQAKLQLDDCHHWADLLNIGSTDLGELIFDRDSGSSAYVLQFANGRRIYSLSSNPNALAGKRGHVTLDEFALHPDQRLLYRVAKPVTTWGGQLSIISTHRGIGTLFYQLVQDAKNGNPMGWSLHEVPIQKAVAEGIVDRINKKIGRNESGEAFLARLRAECIDQEQWDQEYCCMPADENTAFFSYEMLDACTDSTLRLLTLDELLALCTGTKPLDAHPQLSTRNLQLFLGLDVARFRDLCVIDVGLKIDSIMYDLLRLELHDHTFTRMEALLYPLLRLPQLKRACIDSTGMGTQLAEQAREHFGWKVESVNFTAALKEELAFALRREFEDCRLRIAVALRRRKRQGTADKSVVLWGATEIVQPKLSSADLQFLENRKFSRAEICAAFGVPEEILTSTDHAKYDVMQGARLNFIENRVAPLCARLEAEEQRTVKKIDPKAVGWFDLDSLPIMQAARRSRLAAAKIGFDMGIPLNELNRVLDLGFKTLPHGDTSYLPTNLQPASLEPAARNGEARREGALH